MMNEIALDVTRCCRDLATNGGSFRCALCAPNATSGRGPRALLSGEGEVCGGQTILCSRLTLRHSREENKLAGVGCFGGGTQAAMLCVCVCG